MEFKEISLYEAKLNDMPASEPSEGEISTWYALEDEGSYKGFMEVTGYEGISEISYFTVPDIYKGNGYGSLMLDEFLSLYVPESTEESMLTTTFEYNTEEGDELSDIFGSHGFDINLRSFRELTLPFETAYNKLSMKKNASFDGRMVNFVDGYFDVLNGIDDLDNTDISARDIRESSMELSVAAIDPEGKIKALLLVSDSVDSGEAVVTDIYTASDDTTMLRRFLSFAVENASTRPEVPEFISFVAANKKLEAVMDAFFDKPKTSELIIADGEFSLGKYTEQMKIRSAYRR